MNNKTLVIGLIVIVAVVGGLYAASVLQRPKAPIKTISENQKEKGYPVQIEEVNLGDMERYVNLTGSINALNKQLITSKVSGKVASVNFREGERVRAGQVIVTLDSQTFIDDLRVKEMALKQAKANLSQAMTNKKITIINSDVNIKNAKAKLKSKEEELRLAKLPYRNQEIMQAENVVSSAKVTMDKSKVDYDRYTTLYEKKAISLSDLEAAKLNYDVNKNNYNSAVDQLALLKDQGRSENIAKAEQEVNIALQDLRNAEANATQVLLRDEDIKIMKANVDAAAANVNISKDNLSNTKIVSKIDGTMSIRNVEPGQTVNAGSNLGEIVSNNQLFYLANLSEMDVKHVKVGQSVNITIDALSGAEFAGKVNAIYPVADNVTRMYPVRVVLDNDSRIKSGMFAQGDIFVGVSKDVLLIPSSSIISKDGDFFVFKTVDDNKQVKKCSVKVINTNNKYSQVEILTNTLVPGDYVVTIGRELLSDESKINLDNKLKSVK